MLPSRTTTLIGTSFGDNEPGRILARIMAVAAAGGMMSGGKDGSVGGVAKTADIGRARFAQKSFSERFSKGGLFEGRAIDDAAD